MNDQVAQMVSGFKLPYETYKGMLTPEEFAPLEAVYSEMMEIAEKHDDFMAFNDAAMKANIFVRISEEIEKARQIYETKPKEERKTPSAQSFIAQYKALYDQALAAPHTYKTREVYEKLLPMGEGAETPLEVVAAAEQENLFHKIGAMGVYDTYKLDYDKTDPNEELLRNYRTDVMRICEESLTNDEMTYRIDMRVFEHNRENNRDNFIIHLIANLVGCFLDIELTKSWIRIGKLEYLAGLIAVREEAKSTYKVLVDEYGLDWDKAMTIPRYKKRFVMQAAILPETTRVFHAMAPENLEWMKEMLFEEILSDMSAAEMALRKPKNVFHPLTLDEHSVKYGIGDKLKVHAQEVLKDYYWFKPSF
ncbi:hypothetical protein JXM67_08840 [candidate division WOR-3 bacterium]|nr:hypothetical protein [candidate division WOR-3 bacterium]